jgi:hypothetical protein
VIELRPLDVAASVMAATLGPIDAATLADALAVGRSQVSRALTRSAAIGFLHPERTGRRVTYQAHGAALVEFLTYGIRYVFAPSIGRLTRGVPTAHAAPIMASRIHSVVGDTPVWPHPMGAARGETLEPLHRCVPDAALRHPRFYDAMALIDSLRAGRARDRAVAAELLPVTLDAVDVIDHALGTIHSRGRRRDP